MPVNQELLEILVCPETKPSLTLAEADEVEGINQQITRGELVNREGRAVTEPVGRALASAFARMTFWGSCRDCNSSRQSNRTQVMMFQNVQPFVLILIKPNRYRNSDLSAPAGPPELPDLSRRPLSRIAGSLFSL